MRNFQQLAAGVDVGPLLHRLYLSPGLWNQNVTRTAHPLSPHKAVDDIIVRFQDKQSNVVDDPECVWYPVAGELPELRPILFNLARVVESERLGRVVITRLKPGGVIDPHEDGGAVATYYTRYQVVLQNDPGSLFKCGDEQIQFRAGDVWWLNNRITHSVVNNSASDRIVVIVDLKIR